MLAIVSSCTALTGTGEHDFTSNAPGPAGDPDGCVRGPSGSCELLDGEVPGDGSNDASSMDASPDADATAGSGGAGGRAGAGESGAGGAGGAGGAVDGGLDSGEAGQSGAGGEGGTGAVGGESGTGALDECPQDDSKTAPGACGCGMSDADSDDDATPDCHDDCASDPDKTSAGACGCGTADTDSDSDETPDCHDDCASDPDKITAGQCGCGAADTDSDNDEVANCDDGCDNDPNKASAGQCGCGNPDTDTDDDGTADCVDECPDNPDLSERGHCGCGIARVQNYCSQLPYLPSEPEIDGDVECDLPLTRITPVAWSGSVPLPPGNEARYAAAWRPNGIYFYFEIDDPNLEPAVPGAPVFCGDGAQMYVDADGILNVFHDRPGSVQLEVRAPDPGDSVETTAHMYTHPNDATWSMLGPWAETSSFASYPRAGGYVVEALVTASALGMSTFTPVGEVGMTVAITVSDSTESHPDSVMADCPGGFESHKLGQYYLRLGTASPPSCPGREPWCTATAFCRSDLGPIQ